MDIAPAPKTFLDLLRWRSSHQADRRAYTFLLDGEQTEQYATYGELDRRARAIGALLQEHGALGQRVVLLYPPGLDYVAAFVGCLYAGAIAVPAYPPDPSRLERTLPRLQALVADAQPAVALSTSSIVGVLGLLAQQAPDLVALPWLATDDLPASYADRLREVEATSETLAFIQYTSGSTSTPKGVMLSHGNLLYNAEAIHRCFGHSTESRGVIWLPPYHDMGLIGGVLQPLFAGFPVVLMSPIDFLRRPVRWLQAISRYKATTSGGPNFAYDLCVRKVTPEERAALDLSSWDVAFNGAEPVRAETLDRFVAAFAPSGFRRTAFYPCYGLAEATLIVSGGEKASAPILGTFEAYALDRGRVVDGTSAARSKTMVSSGATLPAQELVIVDTESRRACPDGVVGEIWVRGPGVALGYWQRPEETSHALRASLDTGEGPFLRTGDLAFLRGGQLFVTGRCKDVIILRGKNHYPQDLELTAENSHAALRPGCSAAFSVEVAGEERLVLVHEVERVRFTDPAAVADAIRAAVAELHEVQPHAILMVTPGVIPKTSSGKVQRRLCRERFLSGDIDVLGRSVLADAPPLGENVGTGVSRDVLLAAAPDDHEKLVVRGLCSYLASVLGVEGGQLDSDRPLVSAGLDSLKAVELANAIEADFGLSLDLASLLRGASVADLARAVVESLTVAAPETARVIPAARTGPLPLSFSQERLFFLDQLAPGSPAYNISVAVRLEGRLDVVALSRSLASIGRRHESLRTTFQTVDGIPVQRIAAVESVGDGSFDLAAELVDLRSVSPAEREAARHRITTSEAQCPFDLGRGPLLRTRLLRLKDEEHVLMITTHHIVSDGWSMGILLRELAAFYEVHRKGTSSPLADLPLQSVDFAVAQRRELDAGALATHADYWQKQLAGAPTLSSLPCDRPRGSGQTFRGAEHDFSVSSELLPKINAFAREEAITPFMVLFSGFAVALHQQSGNDDLVVGTDVANRNHAAAAKLIGLWVNQLPLRLTLEGSPTFREVARRVRQVTLDAYSHQALPFDKIVHAARPQRSAAHNPLFQVMFVLENAPMPSLALPDLNLELLSAPTGGSPFDISVLLSPVAEGLSGVLRYSTDLFDAATASRLAEAFVASLESGTRMPDVGLPALREAELDRERSQQLIDAERLRAVRESSFKSIRRKSSIDT